MLKKIIAHNRLSFVETNRSSSSIELIIPKELELSEIEANIVYSKYIKINNLYPTNKIQKIFLSITEEDTECNIADKQLKRIKEFNSILLNNEDSDISNLRYIKINFFYKLAISEDKAHLIKFLINKFPLPNQSALKMIIDYSIKSKKSLALTTIYFESLQKYFFKRKNVKNNIVNLLVLNLNDKTIKKLKELQQSQKIDYSLFVDLLYYTANVLNKLNVTEFLIKNFPLENELNITLFTLLAIQQKKENIIVRLLENFINQIKESPLDCDDMIDILFKEAIMYGVTNKNFLLIALLNHYSEHKKQEDIVNSIINNVSIDAITNFIKDIDYLVKSLHPKPKELFLNYLFQHSTEKQKNILEQNLKLSKNDYQKPIQSNYCPCLEESCTFKIYYL